MLPPVPNSLTSGNKAYPWILHVGGLNASQKQSIRRTAVYGRFRDALIRAEVFVTLSLSRPARGQELVQPNSEPLLNFSRPACPIASDLNPEPSSARLSKLRLSVREVDLWRPDESLSYAEQP
jgi:hypothetical protein